MKITVTPICRHPDGWSGSGERFVGQHVIVSSDGVRLDGHWVLERDRRAIRNREPGHPWVADRSKTWTGFMVDVEPNATIRRESDRAFHERIAAMPDQEAALAELDARYHDGLPEGANCRLCGVEHSAINPSNLS